MVVAKMAVTHSNTKANKNDSVILKEEADSCSFDKLIKVVSTINMYNDKDIDNENKTMILTFHASN